MKYPLNTLVLAIALVGTTAAQAALVRVAEAEFVVNNGGTITFSEQSLGTQNPSFSANTGRPSVNFGAYFSGQSLDVSCGGNPPCSVIGTPSIGLGLVAPTGATEIRSDLQNPGTPVLGGNPNLFGPIAILFGSDQAVVSLDGGYFDAIGSTTVRAYSRTGALLGSFSNSKTGFEYFGMAFVNDKTGLDEARIAGLLISSAAFDQAGFAIDNLRFGSRSLPSVVPEPASLALAGLALLGAGLAGRRRQGRLAV